MYDIDMLEGALRHRDKRIRGLEDERDALAAHVERIKACFKSTIATLPSDWQAEMYGLFAQAPETSLARLKAQWAQEGARAAAQAIRMDYEGAIHADDIADFVDEIADDYRRQAEEIVDG